ncbi:MAG: hypothetical protein MCS20_01590, partial [Candidatus Phytoplasma mali]|nr:hypothetical protein [Candidatus Phytoplasma mali]
KFKINYIVFVFVKLMNNSMNKNMKFLKKEGLDLSIKNNTLLYIYIYIYIYIYTNIKRSDLTHYENLTII